MTSNITLQLFDNTVINPFSINTNFDISISKNMNQTIEWEYKNYCIKEIDKSTEIFMDIPNYEGHYQISNFGNIKSLKRNSERIRKPSIDKTKGYYRICLYKNKKRKSFYIHQLVAIVFLDHTPNGNDLVVDHIDNDKTNNRLVNLQIISNRENLSKDKWRLNPTSLYTGVSLNSAKEKWESSISVNGTSYHLGYFTNETVAGLEYKKALEYSDERSNLIDYPFKTVRRSQLSYYDSNQLIIEFCNL